jgi:hypothetical protein
MGCAVAAEKRSAFMDFLGGAGVERWVEIEDAGAAEHGYEITYWEKDGRTIVMLVLNREDIVSSPVAGLRDDVIPITLKFDTPVLDARDERTGAGLGDGMRFDFDWVANQAVVLSFAGDPALPGDANFDGRVGIADLSALADHYGLTAGVGWRQGDFTDDGGVGIADLALLADHYGWGGGGRTAVPEPTCLFLLVSSGLIAVARRRIGRAG